MDLEELKYIGEDAEICWVLDNLQIKYDAYIKKNPRGLSIKAARR